MGLGGALLLWSLLAIAAGFVAVVAAVIFWLAKKRGRRMIALVSAAFAAIGALIAAGAVAFVVVWIFATVRGSHRSTSPDVFQAEFRFAAPPDVQNIQSESRGSTDSEVVFLTCSASRATVQRMISTRFTRASASECAGAGGRKTPNWWTAPRDSAECYVAHPFDHAFSSNRAWLSYDAATGQVHYFYQGVD